MRAKATISALALAVAMSAVLAGPASAAKTGISLSIQAQSAGFFGFVKSKKSSCHSGRKVTLYRKSGRSVKKVGSDTAQPNQDGSQWSISASKKGKYYAKVSATKSCKGATSRTVSGPSASSAHSLTTEEAKAAIEPAAKRGIARGEGKYVKARVRCTVLFPHRVRCSIGYFTKKSLAANEARCVERWMVSFYAHKEKGNSRRMFIGFATSDDDYCR